MSNITSAGNLSINQSLSVGGDTVIGTNGSNILTCNSTPTLNNGLTINGDINQNSTGTIKSGSGGIISNGDVLISSNKKFTSGTGLCTFNGVIQCNQNANLSSLTNTGQSNLANVNCTSLTNTGQSNLANVNCTSLTNTGQSNLANVNCTSLTNTGQSNLANVNCNTLNASTIELGPIGSSNLTYFDMKTGVGNSDYDVRLSVVNGNPSIVGQGAFTIDSYNIKVNTSGLMTLNGITNNGVLNQNNSSNFSNNINAPSISSSSTFFAGCPNSFDSTAISNPKIVNGIASGTADGFSYTNFNLAINSWYSVGFVYSNAAVAVCKLIINNRTGDLNTQGNLTCNSINTTNVNLNSENIYSIVKTSTYYDNGSTASLKILPNTGLYETYLIDLGNTTLYLPQNPTNGTKITIRRLFSNTALTCNIYSYNSSDNVIFLTGQTSGVNIFNMAPTTGITSATFVCFSSNWYQI